MPVVASDGYSAALDRGVEIGPNQSFNPNRDSMAYVDSGWYLARDTCVYLHGMSGDWVNVSNRYLGLKFQIKGKTHYGWARLSVQVGFVYIDATLTGYAYETIAGKSIIAGQKKGAVGDPTDPGLAIQEEEAGQTLPLTTGNGQDDYLAAVEPLFPNQNFVGHCHVVGGVMTGYCEGGGVLVCASKYVPSSCPPGRRVKHVVLSRCGMYTFTYPRYWHTCIP